METFLIKTPDGMTFQASSEAERVAFCGGFCAALMCFGIYKDGVQRIGCQEKPIREYIDSMKAQLTKQDTP